MPRIYWQNGSIKIKMHRWEMNSSLRSTIIKRIRIECFHVVSLPKFSF